MTVFEPRDMALISPATKQEPEEVLDENIIQAHKWVVLPGHSTVKPFRIPRVHPLHGEVSNTVNDVYIGGMIHSNAPKKYRNKHCIDVMDNHGLVNTYRGPQIVCQNDYLIFTDDTETEVWDVMDGKLFNRIFVEKKES